MANKENRGRDIAIFNFTGRLVADAEVRTNKSGKKFATYTVASQTFSQDHANFYDTNQRARFLTPSNSAYSVKGLCRAERIRNS